MQNSPEDFKVNPGAVEALLIHPRENEKILIGYARGLVVLWDRGSTSAVQTYVASQQVLVYLINHLASTFKMLNRLTNETKLSSILLRVAFIN